MNWKKFLATTVSISLIILGAEVGAVGMPASELMRIDEAPRGEVARPMQQTLTSENSGLNPGYSVTPIQNTRPVAPDDVLPNVTATAAIVIEASTGHVLYERNPDQKMFPASTTKMMTLITALEGNKLDEIVTVGPGAYNAEGSTLWLDVGEKIPLGDLLYGMMLISGNDGAIAIAEHCGGNVPDFAVRMTQRAHDLGAVNTNFTNANGLPDQNHWRLWLSMAFRSRTSRRFARQRKFRSHGFTTTQNFCAMKIKCCGCIAARTESKPAIPTRRGVAS